MIDPIPACLTAVVIIAGASRLTISFSDLSFQYAARLSMHLCLQSPLSQARWQYETSSELSSLCPYIVAWFHVLVNAVVAIQTSASLEYVPHPSRLDGLASGVSLLQPHTHTHLYIHMYMCIQRSFKNFKSCKRLSQIATLDILCGALSMF